MINMDMNINNQQVHVQYVPNKNESSWYDGKPIFENQVGVYRDGRAWVVGHMRERGELYEIGRFVSKDKAIDVADHYIKDLIDMGVFHR